MGGGGARTFMHLGVLTELEAAGLRPSYIAGSSLGAILAALYAAQPADCPDPAARAARFALDYFNAHRDFGARRRPDKNDRLHRRSGQFKKLRKGLATFAVAGATAFRPGLRRRHPLYPVIDDWFGGRTIESLRLPFSCVALDLTDATERRFVSGPLAPALKAGVAVGFLFLPFMDGERALVDAAPIAPVPVTACRELGAGRILAVDVCQPVGSGAVLDTGMDVALRIIAAGSKRLNDDQLALADAVLSPEGGDVFWGDFSRGAELVERGAAALREALPFCLARLAGRQC